MRPHPVSWRRWSSRCCPTTASLRPTAWPEASPGQCGRKLGWSESAERCTKMGGQDHCCGPSRGGRVSCFRRLRGAGMVSPAESENRDRRAMNASPPSSAQACSTSNAARVRGLPAELHHDQPDRPTRGPVLVRIAPALQLVHRRTLRHQLDHLETRRGRRCPGTAPPCPIDRGWCCLPPRRPHTRRREVRIETRFA